MGVYSLGFECRRCRNQQRSSCKIQLPIDASRSRDKMMIEFRDLVNFDDSLMNILARAVVVIFFQSLTIQIFNARVCIELISTQTVNLCRPFKAFCSLYSTCNGIMPSVCSAVYDDGAF